MNKAILILFFLLPLLALSKKTYTIEIEVTDRFTGDPIRGAQIYLNEKKDKAMTTDTNGKYTIENCSDEQVQIKLTHHSYSERIYFVYSKNRRKDRVLYAYLTPSGESMKEFFNNLSTEEFKRAKEQASKIDTLLVKPCDSSNWNTGTNAAFPEGVEILERFIAVNIQYPAESYEMEDQGKVLVSFFVEKDGSVSQVSIGKGVTKELDREAKRVIRDSPNWIPAYCNGRATRTRYVIPIVFSLQ
jgi:TonB family protein